TFLDRAVKLLLPREERFFDLLERGASYAKDAGAAMREFCSQTTTEERKRTLDKLRDIEHAADEVIHETYEALNKTFVTPIDRSDIFALANNLEDIVDLVHATAMQLTTHALEDMPAGSVEIAALIAQSTEEVVTAVGLLRDLKQLEAVKQHTKKLSAYEHDGDEVYRAQVGKLFREEKNAVRLIQHKEFLEGLERSLDACDHVGTALSTIVIKNA
ncbi:MAG TPA: DUF47 family protein, partial [Myxococcota bacterium]